MLALFRERVGSPALEQLEQFLDRLIHFLDMRAALMCEVQTYRNFGEEISPIGLHTWFHQTVGLILRRALTGGEIRVDIDLDYLTDAILARSTRCCSPTSVETWASPWLRLVKNCGE